MLVTTRACILALWCVAGCTPPREVVDRLPSPDGRYEAVVARVGRGVTADGEYRIYITRRGAELPAIDHDQLTAHRVDSLHVRWTAPRMVYIEFLHANITYFANEWTDNKEPPHETIELQLVPLDTLVMIRPR